MLDLFSAFDAKEATDGTRTVSLRLYSLGRLTTSGRIATRDPLTADAPPLATRFPAGVHETELLLVTDKGDTRVALARVVFSREMPTSFQLALREGQDPRALAPGQLFGFGVDSGTACFCDASEDTDPEVLLADLHAHEALTWSWALDLAEGGGYRMLAFSSGHGDGVYATWVGTNSEDQPVCLVIDFGCLDLELPSLPDDPSYRRAHAEHALARMITFDLDGDGRAGAYEAATEVRASPADAAHLAPSLFDRYFATSSQSEADLLGYVLRGILAVVEAQRELAVRMPEVDAERLEALLVKPPRDIDDALVDATFTYAARDPRLTSSALRMVRTRQTIDTQIAVCALASLNSGDTFETALRLLARPFSDGELEHPVVPLDAEHLARVTAISVDHQDPLVRASALSLLLAQGVAIDAGLDDASPCRRLDIAKVLSRDQVHRQRANATLRALALDAQVDLELRFAATTCLLDTSERTDAHEAMAMAGHPGANIQLTYIRGEQAMAALERIGNDAPEASIRDDAKRRLARMKKLAK